MLECFGQFARAQLDAALQVKVGGFEVAAEVGQQHEQRAGVSDQVDAVALLVGEFSFDFPIDRKGERFRAAGRTSAASVSGKWLVRPAWL